MHQPLLYVALIWFKKKTITYLTTNFSTQHFGKNCPIPGIFVTWFAGEVHRGKNTVYADRQARVHRSIQKNGEGITCKRCVHTFTQKPISTCAHTFSQSHISRARNTDLFRLISFHLLAFARFRVQCDI